MDELNKKLDYIIKRIEILDDRMKQLESLSLDANAKKAIIPPPIHANTQPAPDYPNAGQSIQQAPGHPNTQPNTQWNPVLPLTSLEFQHKPVPQPANPEGQRKPMHQTVSPDAQRKPVYQAVNPDAQRKPVYQAVNPEDQRKPVYRSVNPEDQRKPVYRSVTPEDQRNPVYRSVTPEDQRNPHPSAAAPQSGGSSQSTWRYSEPTSGTKANTLRQTKLEKNIISVISVLLILCAVTVLVASVWGMFDNFVKFILLLVVGAALQAGGFYTYKQRQQQTMGITLTGCGQGICLLVLLGGYITWGLYNVYLCGILLLLWSVIILAFAKLFYSTIFYVINQIGSLLSICVLLAVSHKSRAYLYIMVVILLITVANFLLTRFVPDICSVVYSAFCCLTVLAIFIWTFSIRNNSPQEGILCFVIMVLITVSSYIHLQSWISENKSDSLIFSAFNTVTHVLILSFLFITSYMERIFDIHLSPDTRTIIRIAAILFLLALVSYERKNTYLKLLCITPILAIRVLIPFDSNFQLHWSMVLMADFIALATEFDWFHSKDAYKKTCQYVWFISSIVSYCFIYPVLGGAKYDVRPVIFILYGVTLALPLLSYVQAIREFASKNVMNMTKYLLSITAISLCTAKLIYMIGLNCSITCLVMTVLIIPCFLVQTQDSKALSIFHLLFASFISLLCYALAYYVLAHEKASMPQAVYYLETAVTFITLLLLTALAVYKAVSWNTPVSFLAFLYAALNLHAALTLLTLNKYEIFVSILLLAVASCGIYAGLKKQNKNMRLFGLIFMILIVFKMVTVDIYTNSRLIRVLSFLAGGIICFALSVLYSKLEQRYKADMDSSENTPQNSNQA